MSGFKRVCEKLKSGNKCCGCVSEKNNGTSASRSGSGGKADNGGIKPTEDVPAATLLLPYFECDANSPPFEE